jgi:hypothetical protein
MESSQAPVFIETEELQKLIDSGANVKIFDVSADEDTNTVA